MKLLLFDVDGTLLLTGGAGIRGMEQAGVLVLGERFSLKQVTTSGGVDPLIFAEALRVCGIDDGHCLHDAFRDAYLRQLEVNLAANAEKVQLLPGIGPLIQALRGRPEVMLGLVTGNYTAAIPIKFRAVGLDAAWFPITAFGDEAPDRPAMVRLARDRFRQKTGREIPPADTIIIGDTPHDVNCAHANGCLCLGVATGMYKADELRRAGADVVVPDLSDPRPLYELLDGDQRPHAKAPSRQE